MAKPVETDTAIELVQSILKIKNEKHPGSKLCQKAEEILTEDTASIVRLMEDIYGGHWNSVTLIGIKEHPRFQRRYQETLPTLVEELGIFGLARGRVSGLFNEMIKQSFIAMAHGFTHGFTHRGELVKLQAKRRALQFETPPANLHTPGRQIFSFPRALKA